LTSSVLPPSTTTSHFRGSLMASSVSLRQVPLPLSHLTAVQLLRARTHATCCGVCHLPIPQKNIVSLRRIRQLADPTRAAETQPRFNQHGLEAERTEARDHLFGVWRSFGWEIAKPIERLWAGEEDLAVLARGCDAPSTELVGMLLAADDEAHEQAARHAHQTAHQADGVQRADGLFAQYKVQFTRIRQLADPETAMQCHPKLNGQGLEAERAEVRDRLVPQWAAMGWNLAEPIERLWAGERELTRLQAGCDGNEGRVVELMLRASAHSPAVAAAAQREGSAPPAGTMSRSCPGGHGLVPFQYERGGYSCDVCGCAIGRRTRGTACRQCDYDVCDGCSGDGDGLRAGAATSRDRGTPRHGGKPRQREMSSRVVRAVNRRTGRQVEAMVQSNGDFKSEGHLRALRRDFAKSMGDGSSPEDVDVEVLGDPPAPTVSTAAAAAAAATSYAFAGGGEAGGGINDSMADAADDDALYSDEEARIPEAVPPSPTPASTSVHAGGEAGARESSGPPSSPDREELRQLRLNRFQ
jgi:hypothetical protein